MGVRHSCWNIRENPAFMFPQGSVFHSCCYSQEILAFTLLEVMYSAISAKSSGWT